MKPKLSYTIWFTQRTGSSLLCRALEATGIAGNPGEWLYQQPLLEEHGVSRAELQERLWDIGNSANGVLGLKHSFYEPAFSQIFDVFKEFPNYPPAQENRAAIWENAFPNHRHIFMTRRNKVRLVVS